MISNDFDIPDTLKSWQEDLKGLTPQEVLKWSVDTFWPGITLASSFGLEDVALIHMISELATKPEIFFLDTGRIHEETYETVERIRQRYDVTIRTYVPNQRDLADLIAEQGHNGFFSSVGRRQQCCEVRKVIPLKAALVGMEAWVTGMRASQGASRTELQVVERDKANGGIIKVNPLANWSEDQVRQYIKDNKVPYNPLHDQGFPSIGCAPCTRAIQPGEDIRAGRWWWESSEKKECGLHRRSES